jgi:uncharacterized repeat protein (TIGR03803 family)
MGKLNWGMRVCGVFLLWATAAMALPAQTFTSLLSFDGRDGGNPNAGLVQGTDGNFYGTTYDNTVFKITPSGTLTTLHTFHTTDGANPYASLILGTNGNFYGTTNTGGANGSGTVFSITAGGKLKTLHSFNGTDGASPFAGVVQGTDGNFYGTTLYGGTKCGGTCGTVFKITPSGKLKTLHNFTDGADGAVPYAGLVQGTDGKFYGTTEQGGGTTGSGTVFSITASGKLTTLYTFCSQTNCTDGRWPRGTMVQGTDGNFYGTTYYGGTNGSYGTVFNITPGGTLTTLHSFDFFTDGADPNAGVVEGTDGNFYGTTDQGGVNGSGDYGTAFSITPSGTLATLYSFCSQSNCTDGAAPSGLVQGTDGNFYGTTANGGTNGGYGTVFALSVGLGPFVETSPASGVVGAAVKILGTNLTGSTSITFNGTSQPTFTVASASEITTTVPTGATTGTVQVVTPGGTLSSNVPFTVN